MRSGGGARLMTRLRITLCPLCASLRVCEEITCTLCCWPPGPLARRERRAVPGAVCEERATKPAGLRAAARRGAARQSAQVISSRTLRSVRHEAETVLDRVGWRRYCGHGQ